MRRGVRQKASGFIECLPKSYDTLVGERGYRLSGDKQQRLSLERATLRDRQLLILDEATSALYSQRVRFERNHTALTIAHWLTTIVKALSDPSAGRGAALSAITRIPKPNSRVNSKLLTNQIIK